MIYGIFTLLVALSLAGVAAWFSIVGLMAIFAATPLSIAIMASTLEVAKLVTASWLYRHWRVAGWAMRTYLSGAVLVLMLITSMGIFGYLSKAHLEQQITVGGDNELRIQNLERRIQAERRQITDSETVLAQMDQTVQTLIEYDRIRGPDGSIATRAAQKPERDALNQTIRLATQSIEHLQSELLPLQKHNLELEAEMGPLKYVAELIYQDTSASTLDRAVRLFILMLVFVFDPLAVMLLLAANQTLLRHGVAMETQYQDTHEHSQNTDPAEPEEDQSLQSELTELQSRAQALQADLDAARHQDPQIEYVEVPVDRVVEKEVIREVPVEVEKIVERVVENNRIVMVDDQGQLITDDLDTAVKLWMEANQHEPVSEQEVREVFLNNEKELKNAQGFWAFPLPTPGKRS